MCPLGPSPTHPPPPARQNTHTSALCQALALCLELQEQRDWVHRCQRRSLAEWRTLEQGFLSFGGV